MFIIPEAKKNYRCNVFYNGPKKILNFSDYSIKLNVCEIRFRF